MTETTVDSEADQFANLSFEAAMAELEEIVSKLERGDVALEASIALFERGQKLKTRCDTLLRGAEARIEKITLSADNRVANTVPLDPD